MEEVENGSNSKTVDQPLRFAGYLVDCCSIRSGHISPVVGLNEACGSHIVSSTLFLHSVFRFVHSHIYLLYLGKE